MIEQDLYEHLKASVPLVGGRVFANVLHQDTIKPAMVYTVISEKSDDSLLMHCADADVTIDWQIHIYGDAYLANKLVKNEVKSALKSFAHHVEDVVVQDGFDQETELYVQIVNFITKD
jgi:hypothetical protein